MEYVENTTTKIHMAWVEFLREKYAPRTRVDPRAYCTQVDTNGSQRERMPASNEPIEGYDYSRFSTYPDSTPVGDGHSPPETLSEDTVRGMGESYYVEYKGQMYEMGATKPKLMEVRDAYDQMHVDMAKARWSENMGVSQEDYIRDLEEG